MFVHPESVTVQTATATTDPYSGEATGRDWSDPTEREEFCAVGDPKSVEPLLDARNAIDSDFTLYFDHDPSISATDRVVVRGLACEVVGHPFTWGPNPFTGWTPGTVVRVKIREG